ncbi:MAG: Rho termination factor N-terminal domain-containing protein [Desulfobaccales bacterium]|nr:Rho termination factor N-terminal domain-containing protein [Desulfobaccales bacterium]
MAKKERKEKKEKPLDKMTATELRKYALDLGEIVGVHGMNKEELMAAVKKVKGLAGEEQKSAENVSMRDLKEKAKEMRGKKLEAIAAGEPQQKIDILRRRANRLKKRTRRAA